MTDLTAALDRQKSDHLYRTRHINSGPQGIDLSIDDKRYLSFCSNDYLGLANHPLLIEALKEGAERYGVGSGASHLITGHQSPHHALEEALANFTGYPRALLFSTGYMANLGVVSALVNRGDVIFQDRLNHASLIDAGRLTQATLKRYQHKDMASLEHFLTQYQTNNSYIASDGVFSMDGDTAPIPELIKLATRFNATLMIDDAHGLGVLGHHGNGVLAHYGIKPGEIPVLVGTLGKAFGTFGAFVAGSEEMIETLIQFSRTYIYTTALPPAVAYATLTSLKLAQQETWRRDHLQKLIDHFKNGAQQVGLSLYPSPTPIQPLFLGDSEKALKVSSRLRDMGILVTAIRPPTVPRDSARLRITFSATHTLNHVDQLLSALEKIL